MSKTTDVIKSVEEYAIVIDALDSYAKKYLKESAHHCALGREYQQNRAMAKYVEINYVKRVLMSRYREG